MRSSLGVWLIQGAAVLLLAGCAQLAAFNEPRPLTQEEIAQQANLKPYQRRIALIFPNRETPRLIPVGDFDKPRSYLGKPWRHTGFDIGGRSGDTVIAVAPGEACVAREQINGLVVYLFPRFDRGQGGAKDLVFLERGEVAGVEKEERYRVRIAYAHLKSAVDEFRGCRFVEFGEVLGGMGTSGIANMPHVHFEVVTTDKRKVPGDPGMQGAINPLFLMRRDEGQPLGSITCYEPAMKYRPNPGDPEDALAIVWPTQKC